MTLPIVERLRRDANAATLAEFVDGFYRHPERVVRDYVEGFRTAADTIERLYEAFEGVCQEADRIRQLSVADAFTDGMKEGASRLRSLATTALAEAGVEK